MEHSHRTSREHGKKDSPYMVPGAILFTSILIAGSLVYKGRYDDSSSALKAPGARSAATVAKSSDSSLSEDEVIPSQGVILPVSWGNLGAKLVENGTIDAEKFESLYRGRFSKEYKNLLYGMNQGNLKITRDNAGYLLNLFWALGLANKNEILEKGEMSDPRYGGAGRFASTGGWTVAKGDPMAHYSKHALIALTPEQQALVDRMSRAIYRPCCNNSTHFPDCNHGMAMLALLELMASQGASEADMWKAALAANSYWFPGTYLTLAAYEKSQGIEWRNVDPQKMLSREFSSSSGYRQISSTIQALAGGQQGSSCGMGGSPSPAPAVNPSFRQSGCGVQ